MSFQPNSPSSWAFQVPGNPLADLCEFDQVIAKFKRGELSEAEFRIIRVPMGIYEQRESGTYMLRVRFPAGGILGEHLRKIGVVAETYGNGILHVTTRQEVQIHRVPLDSILPALRSLAEGGLSCKGGGGNTVRNITACTESGVCPKEVFDVAPYAVALTERLLSDPLSLQLPRKYKIAFAACEQDCSGATVHDAGFIARRQNGMEGFAVYVAGGMGGRSRVATLLHEFVPASEVDVVAEAIKRVFDQHGNRKNKHLARLRFVIEKLGEEGFRQAYEKELAAIRAENPAPLDKRVYPERENGAGRPVPESALKSRFFAEWFNKSVVGQKQPGFYMVHIPLALGDLPASTAAGLASILDAFGDGNLYATQTQNLMLRWVAGSELAELQERLAEVGLADPVAPVLRNLVACAGASTCRLGICLSRGQASAIQRELLDSDLHNLHDLGELTINISGCPNSCGRHPIGNIGLSGATRRIEGKPVPFYAVQLGGRLAEGKTRFGSSVGAIPARNAPAFVRDLLVEWKKSPDAGDFHQFVDHNGKEIAAGLIERHQRDPLGSENKDFYYDWNATAPFSLSGRGSGECSAGLFDLIEIDLSNAREALEAGHLYSAALAAVRSLLITRKLQPKNDQESFELFQKYFVEAGLVDDSLRAVVAMGAQCAGTETPATEFRGTPAEVAPLVASVRVLFENLDSSMRLTP